MQHRMFDHLDTIDDYGVPAANSRTRWHDGFGESLGGLGVLRGLATGSDWEDVQAEVRRETVGRIALVGKQGVGKSTLLARLREQVPSAEPDTSISYEGFFTLVDLSGSDPEAESGGVSTLLDELHDMDLIVYLVDGAGGLGSDDVRWVSRLRSQGMPLLPVLSKADCVEDVSATIDAMRGPMAVRPLPISCQEDACHGLLALVQRIVDVKPDLAIPLAREVPLARAIVVGRVIRQSVMTAAILGAEPIPFLDLPLQVANHMRLTLRMSAVYGQPGMDYRSRELVGTLGASLGARYLMQQALRIIPVLGWLASSVLGALGTWLLGNALARYYEANLDALSSQDLLAKGNPLPRVVSSINLPRPKGITKPAIVRLSMPSLKTPVFARIRLAAGRIPHPLRAKPLEETFDEAND